MVFLKNLDLIFPHKICFENFSASINEGDRISIIGRNGSGKSSLLKLIHEKVGPLQSFLVPQIISENESLSGGERFNKKLSEALAKNPNFLLLDEPTNHLDTANRKSLIRMLKKYNGTVITVTHDLEILKNCTNIIWHIENGKIKIFKGDYDNYLAENFKKSEVIIKKLADIKIKEKSLHEKFQKNQEKAAKSRSIGKKKIENKRWTKEVANTKASKSEKARGKNFQNLNERKKELAEELNEIFVPEVIIPKFNFDGIKFGDSLLIVDGAVGYEPDNFILKNININLEHNLAIVGDNGSGKTTLVRAILGDPRIFKKGQWYVPKKIGYVDQHYLILDKNKTALEIIQETVMNWQAAEVRRHLNEFLFRKNEEVNIPVKYLSGGEQARLCMAKIAADPPYLLILDEITNNIDLETRNHIAQILKNYNFQFIVISHDENFLNEINIKQRYYTNL